MALGYLRITSTGGKSLRKRKGSGLRKSSIFRCYKDAQKKRKNTPPPPHQRKRKVRIRIFFLHQSSNHQIKSSIFRCYIFRGVPDFLFIRYIFGMSPSLDSSDLLNYFMFRIGDSELNLHGLHCYRQEAISKV